MTEPRAVPGIVIGLPEPAVSRGLPSIPKFWAKVSADATLIQGPKHIHAIADPNPAWDPRTGGWSSPPPPSGVGDHRWSVGDLPDPSGFHDGWYWLGDPSSADGTASITKSARQWAADAKTGGPSWNSFFPYKPSVSAVNAYVPGEHQVNHPRVVHFNSHYVEHMWLDLGASAPQPFTWIIVGCMVSAPYRGEAQNLLDAGRDPDAVGFPRLSATAVAVERQIKDNLPYRTSLSVVGPSARMHTAAGVPLRTTMTTGTYARMYVGMFNGSKSSLAVYDPFEKRLVNGKVGNGTAFSHRYTVIGREQGWISQRHASNLMVFEIRYWKRLLLVSDLMDQYNQLSSTYQFDAYRQL